MTNETELQQTTQIDLNDLDSLTLEQLVVLRDGLIELINNVEQRIAKHGDIKHVNKSEAW
jgi:hypothetical protein